MSRREAAYHRIREQLLSGTLRPGSRLSHRALAKEIGVSFIPVREALSQLASEGLVEHRPSVGTFVTDLSREELAEVFDLREALECHVAAKVAGRLEAGDLAAMRQHIEDQRAILAELVATAQDRWSDDQQLRWRHADASFHLVLLRAGRNCRLLKAVIDLRVIAHTMGYSQRPRAAASLERIIDDHTRIVTALAAGDSTAAHACMAEHLRQGCREALESYDRERLQDAAAHRSAD
jgi:DNA-binding GntR family transcriptional regulator